MFQDSGTLRFHSFHRLFMCVTQPSILGHMSHNPVFSNVRHTAQNSLMYVTPPSFSDVCHTTQFLRCMSQSPEFSTVWHVQQFILYKSYTINKMEIEPEENLEKLWTFIWCKLPLLGIKFQAKNA